MEKDTKEELMQTESLYYIMDYSGHYYKLNQNDQLVVAMSEEEAEVFTFAQANSRISNGKKAAFYCIVPLEENEQQPECQELLEESEQKPESQEPLEESEQQPECREAPAENEQQPEYQESHEENAQQPECREESKDDQVSKELKEKEENTADIAFYDHSISEEEQLAEQPEDESNPHEIEERAEQNTISPVRELVYDEVKDDLEKSASTYDLAQMDWAEYLTHFAYIASGINAYRDELAKQHSEIEQKICDILHYIELCETNEEEALDLVELLRVCRENRRDIKDELQFITYFQNSIGSGANVAKAKQAVKSIKGFAKRKYKPRKYDELFENCVLKEKKYTRNDFDEMQKEKERIRQDKSMQTMERECDKKMIKERQDTPFDGKENDWLQFAKRQAEFYRNAGQYISNLQDDLSLIDQKIERILEDTEDANCNVAQGYKVFKQLKELRLEKKAKMQELDCLYALTDYMDCEALADSCEDNLAEVEQIMNVNAGNNRVLEKEEDFASQNEENMMHLLKSEEFVEDKVG